MASFLCHFCKQESWKRKDHLGRGIHDFCSQECALKFRGHYGTGQQVPCHWCSTYVYKQAHRLKRSKNSFCSAKCKKNWEQRKSIIPEETPVKEGRKKRYERINLKKMKNENPEEYKEYFAKSQVGVSQGISF